MSAVAVWYHDKLGRPRMARSLTAAYLRAQRRDRDAHRRDPLRMCFHFESHGTHYFKAKNAQSVQSKGDER